MPIHQPGDRTFAIDSAMGPKLQEDHLAIEIRHLKRRRVNPDFIYVTRFYEQRQPYLPKPPDRHSPRSDINQAKKSTLMSVRSERKAVCTVDQEFTLVYLQTCDQFVGNSRTVGPRLHTGGVFLSDRGSQLFSNATSWSYIIAQYRL